MMSSSANHVDIMQPNDQTLNHGVRHSLSADQKRRRGRQARASLAAINVIYDANIKESGFCKRCRTPSLETFLAAIFAGLLWGLGLFVTFACTPTLKNQFAVLSGITLTTTTTSNREPVSCSCLLQAPCFVSVWR